MGHLQRLLRGLEQNAAEIAELRRELAIMERQVQNIASDSFGGDIGESGNMFIRPGEIRIGSALKIDKNGITFAKGVTSPFQIKWRDTFAGITRALISGFVDEDGDAASMSLTVDGLDDWDEKMTLRVRGGNDGARVTLISDDEGIGEIRFEVFFESGSNNVLKLFHDHMRSNGTLILRGRGDAVTDALEFGQIWVKNTTPRTLLFTDDEGVDFEITMVAAATSTHMIVEKEALTVGEAVTVTIA